MATDADKAEATGLVQAVLRDSAWFNVCRTELINFGIDLRDGGGAVAEDDPGSFNTKLPAEPGRGIVP